MGLAVPIALMQHLGCRGVCVPLGSSPQVLGTLAGGGYFTAACAGFRIGGEIHSMVWDPTGERLAVIIRGKREVLPPPCLPQRWALPENPPSSRQKGHKPCGGEKSGWEGSTRPPSFLTMTLLLCILQRGMRPSSLPTSSWTNHLSQPPRKVSTFPQCPHYAWSPTGPLGSVFLGAALGIIEPFRLSWMGPALRQSGPLREHQTWCWGCCCLGLPLCMPPVGKQAKLLGQNSAAWFICCA